MIDQLIREGNDEFYEWAGRPGTDIFLDLFLTFESAIKALHRHFIFYETGQEKKEFEEYFAKLKPREAA